VKNVQFKNKGDEDTSDDDDILDKCGLMMISLVIQLPVLELVQVSRKSTNNRHGKF